MKYQVGKIGDKLTFVLDRNKALKPESQGISEIEIGDYIVSVYAENNDYSTEAFLKRDVIIEAWLVSKTTSNDKNIGVCKEAVCLDYEHILEICRAKTRKEPEPFNSQANSFIKDLIHLTALFCEVMKEAETDNKLYYWEFKMSDGWHKSEKRMTEIQARAFVGDNVPMERLDALGFREE